MLENLSWTFFEKTGNIEAFLEYKKIKEINVDDKGAYNYGNDN